MSKQQKGCKILLDGLPNTAKSTVASSLDEVFVYSFDYDKAFPFNVPHTTIYPLSAELPTGSKAVKYQGMKKLKEVLLEKLLAYGKVYGKYPKTVVFDTVTGMYGMLTDYNSKKYSGFDVHSNNNSDTELFNSLIESLFIKNGINVVIIAHVMYDEKTDCYVTPAQGNFKKRGAWISGVDFALYLAVEDDERVVHHTTIGLPCRSLLKDIPSEEPLNTFNFQEYIDKVIAESKEIGKLEF